MPKPNLYKMLFMRSACAQILSFCLLRPTLTFLFFSTWDDNFKHGTYFIKDRLSVRHAEQGAAWTRLWYSCCAPESTRYAFFAWAKCIIRKHKSHAKHRWQRGREQVPLGVPRPPQRWMFREVRRRVFLLRGGVNLNRCQLPPTGPVRLEIDGSRFVVGRIASEDKGDGNVRPR